ncbi:hypothetical protein [Kineosporia sp. R_H_3]|uniref:hypothetical protein n=1 Tax=Kineosporia sp. R_H_3 TaxID=1961848 RepID=UPI000B4AA143|nr:hypothetical protein [Kineosporia sp. R_H_3]
MTGRRSGVLTGALVAVALVVAGGTLLADDLAGVLGGATGPVAWTQESAAPEERPGAAAKKPAAKKAAAKKDAAAKKKSAAKQKAAAKKAAAGATGGDAAAGAVSAAGYGPDGPQGPGTCCSGGSGTTQGGLPRVRGPQVVKGSNPPSVRLVVPGVGGVDRGIADTGTHSDGTQYSLSRPLRYHPGSQTTLEAAPSAGRVDLSWFHNGDPATLTYRVGYQPNTWIRSTTRPDTWTTPPIVWVDVPPAAAEGVMSWRLARAARGVEYTFWLEVDLSTPPPEDVLGSTRMLLARTSHVLVP